MNQTTENKKKKVGRRKEENPRDKPIKTYYTESEYKVFKDFIREHKIKNIAKFVRQAIDEKIERITNPTPNKEKN